MAKNFTEWTVLDHDEIEKHESNLWSVSGKMPGGNQRRMTLAKMASGDLVIHNAIALREPQMAEMEALGRPRYLIVPNAFHRQDALIMKQRYPELMVIAPKRGMKAVSKLLPVDGTFEDVPRDSDVKVETLRGFGENEGVLTIRSEGRSSLVFNDAVLNIPESRGLMGFFLSPTGRISVPRFARFVWMKKREQFREHLLELAANENLAHLITAHGAVVNAGASEKLHFAAKEL